MVAEVAEAAVFPGHAHAEMKEADARALLRRVWPEAAEFIADGKTSLDFGSLNRIWHRGGNRLPLELRPYKALGSWHPLFEGEIQLGEGLSIAALKSTEDLRVEGETLRHCVGNGGYGSSCQAGEAHIVSIRKDGVPVATVELGVSERGDILTPDGRQWRVKQFRASNNMTPGADAQKAWKVFKEKASRGEIKLTAEHGRTEQSKRLDEKLTAVTAITGYELEERECVVPKILAHYRKFIAAGRGKREAVVPLLSAASEQQILKGCPNCDKK